MDIYKDGRYWYVKNERGPVPKHLKGAWTTPLLALEAIEMFRSGVRQRAVNVSERTRLRKERSATSNAATTSRSE